MASGLSEPEMARILRDRFELAAVRDDDAELAKVAREVFWFSRDHHYFILHVDCSSSTVAEKPRRIVSKYEGRCRACGKPIVPGESVVWTPGTQGVCCLRCGESKP